MNHLDETTLNLYLDNALEPSQRGQVEAHLVECLQCQREVAAMQALFGTFEAWHAEPMPRDVTPQVLTRIAQRPSPTLVRRGGAVLLGAQLVIALVILAWLLPMMVRVVSGLSLDASVFDFNPLAQWGALLGAMTISVPAVSLWVGLGALAVLALVWFFGTRLILGSVERTEATQ